MILATLQTTIMLYSASEGRGAPCLQSPASTSASTTASAAAPAPAGVFYPPAPKRGRYVLLPNGQAASWGMCYIQHTELHSRDSGEEEGI